MPANSLYRLAGVLAVTIFLGSGLSAAASTADAPAAGKARAAIFQPLHIPATGEQHPGKFIWADLFTTDPAAATKFYCGLFGWTANTIEQDGKSYIVFSNGSRPVAGLAPRRAANSDRPARWISYIAVPDLNSTLALVAKAGGRVRAPAREFPDRGSQAIVTDNQGAPVGLLQSSSGDTADDEPKTGDWNWFELYIKDPKAASAFYGQILNYAVAPDTRTTRKNDYLLNNGEIPRGGIAPLPEREGAQPGWLGVVRVESIDKALTRVAALGGEVLVAPRAAAYESRFAIVADSTGGTIGLVEYVDNTNPATRP